MAVMGTTTARVLALGTSRFDCGARLCTPHTPRSHTPENGRNSRHVFNTKAVSRKLPQNTVSVSHPRVHSGIVKTRDVPLARFGTGVQHTGKACAAGGAGAGWGGSQRPQVRFPPFLLGVQTWGLGRETAGPNRGVARSNHSNSFFSCIEKIPIPFQQVNGIALDTLCSHLGSRRRCCQTHPIPTPAHHGGSRGCGGTREECSC